MKLVCMLVCMCWRKRSVGGGEGEEREMEEKREIDAVLLVHFRRKMRESGHKRNQNWVICQAPNTWWAFFETSTDLEYELHNSYCYLQVAKKNILKSNISCLFGDTNVVLFLPARSLPVILRFKVEIFIDSRQVTIFNIYWVLTMCQTLFPVPNSITF